TETKRWGSLRRRLAAGAGGLALALTLIVPAAPAAAQGATPTPPRVGEALQKAETLRTQRPYAEMLPGMQPYADSNNFDAYIMIGRAYEGLKLPPECLKAVEWHTKAIALQPNNPTGYERRAGAYDCLGVPYFVQRLADREHMVDLADSGGKTPS